MSPPFQRDFTMSLNKHVQNQIDLKMVSSKDGDQSSKFMPTPTQENHYNPGLKSWVLSSASKHYSNQKHKSNLDIGHLKMTKDSNGYNMVGTPQTIIHPLDGSNNANLQNQLLR